jgi:hypothetical protein
VSDEQPRISAAISRKLNIGNYESVELFVSVSGIAPDATAEEIAATLEVSSVAFSVLRTKLAEQIAQTRSEHP